MYDDAIEWQKKYAYENVWIERIGKRMIDF